MTSKRTIFTVFGIASVVASAAFGWQLWITAGSFDLVVWSIEEGGLTLSYIPGKGSASTDLRVDTGYVRGSRRTWVMVDPGATRRIAGASSVPLPEELLSIVRISMERSDPIGLCNLYDDVGESQRQDIVVDLVSRSKDSSELRDALQRLLDGGEYPWLVKVLDE